MFVGQRVRVYHDAREVGQDADVPDQFYNVGRVVAWIGGPTTQGGYTVNLHGGAIIHMDDGKVRCVGVDRLMVIREVTPDDAVGRLHAMNGD